MRSTLLLILGTVLAAFAEPTIYRVIPGDKHTEVTFTSDAPMETVVGQTRTVTGYVELDPSRPGAGARGEIHVDLASLDTGLKLRNRHMRENHLETDKYPEAVFTLTSLRVDELRPGVRTPATVRGEFSLHGVKRGIEPEVHLTLDNTEDEPTLHIEADFTVLLEDYEIDCPQFLLLKLSREQLVHVDIVARGGLASSALTTP